MEMRGSGAETKQIRSYKKRQRSGEAAPREGRVKRDDNDGGETVARREWTRV